MEIITNPNQNIENLGGYKDLLRGVVTHNIRKGTKKTDALLTKSLERREIKFGLRGKFEGACLWGRVIGGVEGLSEAGGVSDGDWGKVGSILIASV